MLFVSSLLVATIAYGMGVGAVPYTQVSTNFLSSLFIGPESDHWLCLSISESLSYSLTHSRFVNLIDVTLACEMPTQNLLRLLLLLKFVMRIVGNNLLQIWKRGLVIKLNFCSGFEHFGLDFEVEAQARF